MSTISREVEKNNQDWARSSGANVQRAFPDGSATQPRNPQEFLGPTGGAQPQRKSD
jgi:hypothetical protein